MRFRIGSLFKSPLKFLALYIALLPAFAIVYFFLCPGDFYAPYLRYEPRWRDTTAHVAYVIQQAMKREIFPSNNAAVLHPDDIAIVYAEAEDGHKFNFVLQLQGRYSNRPAMCCAALRMSIDVGTARSDPMMNGETFLHIADDDFPGYLTEVKQFYPTMNSLPSGINLREDEMHTLDQYLEGVAGYGPLVENDFFRMLYLSVVVLTTLGLGDIIPLTNLARGLVGAEAISGIILAGLFLNSLSARRANEEMTRPDVKSAPKQDARPAAIPPLS